MKQKLINRKFALMLLGILCTFGMGQAVADSPLQAVVQSYTTDTNLQYGMIVKLNSKDGSKVEAATLADIKKMVGVVVSSSDAAVTLSSQASAGQQAFVATSGRYNVLVSNQDGTINVGDYITISSLDGVGMKADSHESEVLGKAEASFDGIHDISSTTTVRDQNNKSTTVAIGRIAVDVTVGSNPLAVTVSNVPGFLQRAGSLVTDKPLNAWRLYGSFLIIVGAMIIAGVLLYSGVRNGMVAIGRNPLAKASITGNLAQVVIVSVIMLVIGLTAAYLLLKL